MNQSKPVKRRQSKRKVIDRIIADREEIRRWKYIGSYHIYIALEKSVKYLDLNLPVHINRSGGGDNLSLLSADCRDIFKEEYAHWSKLKKEPKEFRPTINKALRYYEYLARQVDDVIYAEKAHLF